MAMTVLLRSATGKVLRSLTNESVRLSRILPPPGDPDFPFLGLLDPYGDTFFSRAQMQAVIPEIRRLRTLSLDADDELLSELEELAVECRDGNHVFLIFVGD
jgi:hypothetical protein